MKTLKQIREAKQVGTIYHYTTIEKLHDMIHQDHPFTMHSHNGETISASRNSNLPMQGGYNKSFSEHGVRIALDGDKISEHHKVKPVAGLTDNESDVMNHKHNDKYRVKRSSGEAEEAIFKQPLNIHKYIKHIHIIKHRNHDDYFEHHIKPKLTELGIKHTYSKSLDEGFVREDFFEPFNQLFEIL